MTAYIKMVDVWMIFTMMYPFSVVTLYSVLEYLKEDDLNTVVMLHTSTKMRITILVVTFILHYGLPVVAVIFTVFF